MPSDMNNHNCFPNQNSFIIIHTKFYSFIVLLEFSVVLFYPSPTTDATFYTIVPKTIPYNLPLLETLTCFLSRLSAVSVVHSLVMVREHWSSFYTRLLYFFAVLFQFSPSAFFVLRPSLAALLPIKAKILEISYPRLVFAKNIHICYKCSKKNSV